MLKFLRRISMKKEISCFIQNIVCLICFIISLIILVPYYYIYTIVFGVCGCLFIVSNFLVNRKFKQKVEKNKNLNDFLQIYFYTLLTRNNYEIAFNKAFPLIKQYVHNLSIEELRVNPTKLNFLNFGPYFKFFLESFLKKIDSYVIKDIIMKTTSVKMEIYALIKKESKLFLQLNYGMMFVSLLLTIIVGLFGSAILTNGYFVSILMLSYLILLNVPYLNKYVYYRRISDEKTIKV